MSKKGKDGDDPHREQGPGVPWEPILIGEKVPAPKPYDASEELRKLRETLGAKAPWYGRPPVQLHPPKQGAWVPRTFSVAGKAGERLLAENRGYVGFQGEEFFAMDDSSRPGHGTLIKACFHGASSLFPNGCEIPTWMFYEWVAPEDRKAIEELASLVGTAHETPEARAAKSQLRIISTTEKMTWARWDPGLQFFFQIEFRETCRWEGVMWGWELRGGY